MWGGDRSVADMLPYDSAVLAFYQGIIGGPISPRLGELDPQFFQHCATIRLINSEPLSQWKPSKRNGNGWSIAIGTGIRCLSEMVPTQPSTCLCVTGVDGVDVEQPASPSWLPWCTVSNRRLPRLRVLHAHALAAVDCRVAQVINVKPRCRPVAQTPFSRTLHAPVASLAESPDRTGLHARRPHRPAGRCLPPCTFAESSPRQAGLRWTRLVFIQRPIHRVNCARLSPVIFARKRRTIPFWPRLIRRYCCDFKTCSMNS